MTKEFNLSKREVQKWMDVEAKGFMTEDVKEFIKLLKEEITKEINLNNIFLLNKSFKGKKREMVESFQDKLIELRRKMGSLAGEKLK